MACATCGKSVKISTGVKVKPPVTAIRPTIKK